MEKDVPGAFTIDRMALSIAADAGLGVAYALEDAVAHRLETERFGIVLSEWRPAEDRYMLSYPGRCHAPRRSAPSSTIRGAGRSACLDRYTVCRMARPYFEAGWKGRSQSIIC